jgi:hypothetical protein
MYWPLTVTSSLLNRVMTYIFYVYTLNYQYVELIYPLIKSWVVLAIIIYMWEKTYKTLYI